ncbi:uncharacterized protein LOC134251230 [Saccostrea cucullata]|uniref:uncharacterized protein LOC134251230 n=1 Tax=Saccostrea cuccullata TaxID=36930 RepID=UPI002ED0CB60
MTALTVLYVFLCIGGTFADKVLPEKEPSVDQTLLSSTTDGKLSGVLRNVLNQESLVRFSMAQKFQTLVLDVLDNQNSSRSLQRKVVNIAKELKALETRDQMLEEENLKLKEELKMMNESLKNNRSQIMEEMLDEFDTRLKMVEEKMINFSTQHTPDTRRKVYFSAGISKEKGYSAKVNGNNVILFQKVISNEGGAYNPSTGVFSAPVSGVYVFSCFILKDKTTNFVYLEVNGLKKFSIVSHSPSGSRDGLESAGNLAVLNLQQGDRVIMTSTVESNLRSASEAPSTTFSGFLLY